MKFTIHHHTRYAFDRPVFLEPHVIRLHPRPDPSVQIREHRIDIVPQPVLSATNLDLHGNTVTEAWFDDETTSLQIDSFSVVESLVTNPFRFISAEPDRTLPYTYPVALRQRLAAYISDATLMSPELRAIALDIATACNRRPERYPLTLAMHLQQHFALEVRPEGDAQSADATIQAGHGACRDLAVLFVECCRAMGLAARFVSGYAYGSDHEADLHAWGEVYLPGGGWRGFDPSWGLAVSDRHVAVAAGRHAQEASPVQGTYRGEAASSLETTIELRAEPLDTMSVA